MSGIVDGLLPVDKPAGPTSHDVVDRVRRGLPRGIGGLTDVVKSPQHATAVGLLLYGARQGKENRAYLGQGDGASVRERFLSWVKELF